MIRLLVLVCMGIATSWAANQVARLYCLRDDTKYTMRFIVYHKNDPLTTMFAVNDADVQDPDCIIAPNIIIHDTKDEYYKVEVTYIGTNLQSLQSCSPVKASGLNKYTWTFKTRTESGPTFANIIFGSDMDYTLKCDFDSVTENLVNVRSIDVTGTTLQSLTHLKENVNFQARLASDDSVLTTVALGNQIYLYLQLVPVTDGATGVYAHTCKACDLADCSGVTSYDLTDVDGCYLAGTHLGTATLPSFVGTNGLESQTANFDNFVFNGGVTDVIFICKIGYCYRTALGECHNLCSERNPRKKRDVSRRRRDDSGDKNNTIGMRLRIEINDSRQVRRYTPSLSDGTMCTTRLVFVATAITIAALLAVSIFVATALFCRIRRARSSPKN